MVESVSIRYNNPGAMWGNALATKWGATGDIVLNDGQKNHIAVFPTKVQGAAAQFDLWSRNYTNMTLGDAIKKWSGGNSSLAYVSFLVRNTGIADNEVISANLLSSPTGMALLKAQAKWECGKDYPMSDAEWRQAQYLCFANKPPVVVKKSIVKHVVAGTTAGAAAAAGAHSAIGNYAVAGVFAAVVVAGVIYLIFFRGK